MELLYRVLQRARSTVCPYQLGRVNPFSVTRFCSILSRPGGQAISENPVTFLQGNTLGRLADAPERFEVTTP